MTEEWRTIEGFEGYQVSNLGRVRSVERVVAGYGGRAPVRRGKVLRLNRVRGYLRATLSSEGRICGRLVHRLVAHAFLPKPHALASQVNHRDFNVFNNAVSNLEWVTPQENNQHRIDHGRFDGYTNASRRKKMNPQSVRKLREERASTGLSYAKLGEKYGIAKANARQICIGASWREPSGPAV